MTGQSQPLASSNGPGPVSMPSRYGRAATARNRKSRLFSILQNPGPTVGVVPLQLTQPQSRSSPTDPSMPWTPTPLSSLPHSSSKIPADSPMLPTPTPLSSLPHSKIPAPFAATDSLPDIVSLVVRKTLEQIGVQTVEVTRTPRKSRTSLGQKRDEIKKQRTMISGNADKEWKVSIQNLSWNPF
jgi:hypothetical protein